MPAPAIYGVVLSGILMACAGAWSWQHRDRSRTRRTIENWLIGIAVVVIIAALWAALLQPWPRAR